MFSHRAQIMSNLPLFQEKNCPLPLSEALDGAAVDSDSFPLELRIGELSRITGKSARALRLYEEMGLLVPGNRSAGGFRLYDRGSIDRVVWIGDLQELGFTLHEIRILIEGVAEADLPRDGMGQLRALYDTKLKEIRTQISRLARLERELRTSLGYLQVCGACPEESQVDAPCSVCGEHGDKAAPELVRNAAELAGLKEERP